MKGIYTYEKIIIIFISLNHVDIKFRHRKLGEKPFFYQTIIKDHDHFVYNVPGKEKKHTRDAPQYFNKIAKNHHVGLTKVTYFNDNRILFNTNEKDYLIKEIIIISYIYLIVKCISMLKI